MANARRIVTMMVLDHVVPLVMSMYLLMVVLMGMLA